MEVDLCNTLLTVTIRDITVETVESWNDHGSIETRPRKLDAKPSWPVCGLELGRTGVVKQEAGGKQKHVLVETEMTSAFSGEPAWLQFCVLLDQDVSDTCLWRYLGPHCVVVNFKDEPVAQLCSLSLAAMKYTTQNSSTTPAARRRR